MLLNKEDEEMEEKEEIISSMPEGHEEDVESHQEAVESHQEVVEEKVTKKKIFSIPPMLLSPFRKQKGERRFHILTILDRYILKKFLGTYIMATALFLAVISMFAITEKLDAFLTAPLKETIFDYFASFLPYMGNQLSPLFVFITVIFFTTKLAGNSEIIAIMASGVSFSRLLRPYMVGAAVIAALTFALSNYIIPPTNINRINYYNKYVKNKSVTSGTNIMLQARPGEVVYLGSFDNESKFARRFSMDKFKDKQLVSRMTATSAIYDSTRLYHWQLHDYMIRDFQGMNEKITRGTTLDTIIPIEPRDFLIAADDAEKMTTPQLSAYIDRQKMRGVANIQKFEIEKEKRYASTAAAFILTLIGMSLSAKKVKGGMGLNIGIGLGLSFSYILFSSVTSSLAVSGLTSPRVAMEIPNVVYLLIGLYLYRRASKF